MRFHLQIMISWTVGKRHEYRSKEIDKKFEADSKEKGIIKANIISQKYHDTHSQKKDYGMSFELSLITLIWEGHLDKDKPAYHKYKIKHTQAKVSTCVVKTRQLVEV